MSLLQKLETAKLEVIKNEIQQEIARLDDAKSVLLSQGQKISNLLGSLLESSEDLAAFGDKKQELDALFFADQELLLSSEDVKKVNIKKELKEMLSELDLKFSGGKKGSKPNRELAIENIFKHLESLKIEINNLEKDKQDKYLKTSEGRDQFERENENKERCRQEVLRALSRLEDVDKISDLKISPKHLELAGVYGVELTQGTILSEWKKMASELLLHHNFSDSKENIKSFQKYKPLAEDNDRLDKITESAANLKSLEDQTVLALADIIAKDPEVKQRFNRYGLVGASLNPDIRKKLATYDDLPEDQISDSPAALAYEYVHHLLHVSAGSDYSYDNHLNSFTNLFRFSNSKDDQYFSTDVFGKKYLSEYFHFSGNSDHDLEFLSQLSSNLEKLILALHKEIKTTGSDIDPRSFIARFGTENYNLIKELPKISDLKDKMAIFPKEYSDSKGPLTKKYYQDEAIFNQFDARNKQLAEKLDLILSIRWLEEELNQKYQNNPDVWEILDNKIKLVDYLNFLEQNREYHAKQLIGVSVNQSAKIELLDIASRQDEYDLQMEYEELENKYKEYLKTEIAGIISEINRIKGKVFNKNDKLISWNERLGTCQVLSSHKLSDRIYNQINGSSSKAFKEESLTPAELETIKSFTEKGRDNLNEQETVRDRYRASEKDLDRFQDKPSAEFLLDYPDFVNNIFTYETLIANLKLINLGLSSLLREKYFNLVKNFSIKSKKYKELINDYNRKYNREGAGHLIPAIDFREDLADYL